MKVFATSDIHGNTKILNKIENFLKDRKDIDDLLICGDVTGKHFKPDSTFMERVNLQRKDLKRLEQWLHVLELGNLIKGKGYYILGNDDWVDYDYCEGYYMHYLPHQKYITYRRMDYFPFELVSIAITRRLYSYPLENNDLIKLAQLFPFNTNREANERKIEYELMKLLKYETNCLDRTEIKTIDTSSIIVAHCPPCDCLDLTSIGNNPGSVSIRKFIEKVQPRIWLCGHIHEAFGMDNIDDTLVFNCACDHVKDTLRGWVIDLETLKFEEIEC